MSSIYDIPVTGSVKVGDEWDLSEGMDRPDHTLTSVKKTDSEVKALLHIEEESSSDEEEELTSKTDSSVDVPLQLTTAMLPSRSPEAHVSYTPLHRGWNQYKKSKRTRQDLSILLSRFEEWADDSYAYVNASLIEAVKVMSPNRLYTFLHNVFNVGKPGFVLYDMCEVSGYLKASIEMCLVMEQMELERTRKYEEKTLDSLKTVVTELQAVLKTYGEGANTFKKNLDAHATFASKLQSYPTSLTPMSISRPPSSVSSGRSMETILVFSYHNYVLVCNEEREVNISASLDQNKQGGIPENLREFIKFGNQLLPNNRNVLYRTQFSSYASISKEAFEKKFFKTNITLYQKRGYSMAAEPPKITKKTVVI